MVTEGSGEEVNDFLERIRALSDKRDREDIERSRQLEADILAGREARRAKRDERARSLSPQKDSPGGTPISLKSTISRPATRDGEDAPGRYEDSTSAALEKLSGKLADVTVSGSESTGVNADSPRPTPTLSWQRRPKSMVGTYGLSKLSPPSLASDAGSDRESPEKSRAQIAANLGSKEPLWFRQTQERAAASGALRKAEEESMVGVSRMALPGMSPPPGNHHFIPPSTPEPQKPTRGMFEPRPTTRLARSGSLKSDRFTASMTPDLARSTSTASNSSGRFELDTSNTLARPSPMSPSQERLSPERERTPSPTKGFGGFVQSAMLKREGSINKRWSRTEQAGGAPARNTTSTYPRSITGRDQDAPAAHSSRASTPAPEDSPAESPKAETPVSTTRGRSKTTSEGLGRPMSWRDSTPPDSPTTKTYEQKRWSPTKSSWLETALKKGTDNPQPPMAPAKPLAPSKFPDRSVELSPYVKPSINPKPPVLAPKPSASPDLLKKASEKPPEQLNHGGRDHDTSTKPLAAGKPSGPSSLHRSSVLLTPTSSRASGIDIIGNKPPLKPKEQINFRASLKPRPVTGKGEEKEELPFLNAMSRLKSTRTQNYRAPNEFKEQLVEGKAGLNATGGPQKPTRVDPLKESLLSAKGSLRHSESLHSKPTSSLADPKPPLRPSESLHSKPTSSPVDPKPSLRHSESLRSKPTSSPVDPKPSLRHSESLRSKPTSSPVDPKPSLRPSESLHPKPASSPVDPKLSLRHADTSPAKSAFSPIESKPKPPLFEKMSSLGRIEMEKKTSAPGRIEMEKRTSTLADRFNPSLSNLLQRGPPTVASGNAFRSSRSQDASPTPSKSNDGSNENESGSAPLKHMTKGRARGPKRRAPTQSDQPSTDDSPSKQDSLSTQAPARAPSPRLPGAPSKQDNLSVKAPAWEPSPRFPETPSKQDSLSAQAPARAPSPRLPETPNQSSIYSPPTELPWQSSKTSLAAITSQKTDKPKPPTPAKSPLLRSTSTSSLKESDKFLSGPAAILEEAIRIPPRIKSPSSNVLVREPSLGRLSSPAKAEDTLDLLSGTGVSPIRLPKRDGERRGLGIPGFSLPPQVVGSMVEKPMPRLFSRSVSPMTQVPQPVENIAADRDNVLMLSQFFKGPSFHANKVAFDILSILASSPAGATEKVMPLQFEVSEITSHGKLIPISREIQHVFFDESMYLCTHHFEAPSGRKEVEVYLWSGIKVSEGAIEDAQLFARKNARENDGKLIQLKQGRETPNFFQAIGGILITRRGTRERSSVDNSFMLCGRNCFGGVAFDEVDTQVSSLCSGFPYILSSKEGVYLWKGKGATPDEVGVARLVGFEVSGGEVRECSEGDEPDSFFEALGGYSEIKSANYWHLRPSSRKYASRLFKIDLQSKSKIIEIYPFCQDDLDPHEIYVADAFFEFYIVIGSQSQSKREEFQAALQFTQEYTQLAVPVEDRPFIPVSSVILGGAPREFRALFRTWDNSKIPTQWQPSRKPSLRLIGLPQAMEAMNF